MYSNMLYVRLLQRAVYNALFNNGDVNKQQRANVDCKENYHMFPFFFFADYIIFLFKACQNIILTFYSLIKSLPPLIQDLNLIIYFASRRVHCQGIKRRTYTYQNIYAKLSFCCILIRFTSVSDKHKIWVLFFTFSNF